MEKIISGYVSVSNYGEYNVYINGREITDILWQMVCDEPTVGKNVYKDSGLGKKKTIIYNCQMYAYFTKDECTLDEAKEAMDVYLYTGEGVCECSGEYSGYSEWTITGFDIDEFEIDGHDLKAIFNEHAGEYVNFVINY